MRRFHSYGIGFMVQRAFNEKYNPGKDKAIKDDLWEDIYLAACNPEFKKYRE